MLELHGWGDLQTELNTLSKRGEWDEMAELIDDDILDAFAVVGELDDIAGRVLARFGGVVDRFNFYAPYRHGPRALGRRCWPVLGKGPPDGRSVRRRC